MNIIVAVHAESLLLKLAGAPTRVRQALLKSITKSSVQVQRAVKEGKLTGQVLHVRTGTLRRSINREVIERDDGIFAVVGTNVKYGAAWEQGFTKRIGAGARGGPKGLLGMARERYFMKHPPGEKNVVARPFLRPTLEEFKPRIREDLRNAVLGALR